MAEIKNTNGTRVIDYMARDYDSLLLSMRDQIPEKLPEWKEYLSEADFGNVLLQLFAHMGDILSYYQDRVANESFLETSQTRRSVIHHLKLIGYKLSTAAPAAASLQLNVPSTVDGTVTITKGNAFATKSQKDKPSVRFEYTYETDLTIDWSLITPDSVTNRKYYDGIPVEEGRLVKDEILGTSDGKPNQQFMIAHSGLILRSVGTSQQLTKDIILTSELGSVTQEWTLQESLAFSAEGQNDFVIEIDDQDRTTIKFGDGNLGAIPDSGCVFKVTYRVGGGTDGNVTAETIQTIIDAPDLVLLGAKVTNPDPATGGAERETEEHAIQHAPTVFRSLKRAVTADDYEALALDFKGVGKVRAERSSWNEVILYVAPEGGGYVSDVLRANLLAYFEDKRPLSTIVAIEDVDYVKIYVTAEIGVGSYYSTDDITEKVQAAGYALLEFDNVDFKQVIYLSKFYEAIEDIDGVEYVTITEFRRDGQEDQIESRGKIVLQSYEIPRIPGTLPDDPESDSDYAAGIKVVIGEEGT